MPVKPAANGLMVAVGASLRIKLESALSTSTNKVGDTFSGRVTDAVVRDGKTLIPAGASVQGHLTQVSGPRRIRGVPVLHLIPESVTMPSGETFTMSAVVVDTADPKNHNV